MRFDSGYFANFESRSLQDAHYNYEKLSDTLIPSLECCIPEELGSSDQVVFFDLFKIIMAIYDRGDSAGFAEVDDDVDAHYAQIFSLFKKFSQRMTPPCRDRVAEIRFEQGNAMDDDEVEESHLYAEDRASMAFFNCKFDVIFKKGWKIDDVEGVALIKKCWNVLKNNILNVKDWRDMICEKIIIDKDKNAEKNENFFKNNKLQIVNDDFTKGLSIVGNQLENYKELLLLSYKSVAEQQLGALGGTIDSKEASGLAKLLTMESQQKDHVLFWARKIMLHMIQNHYKRLTRYAYVSPVDSSSAAYDGTRIAENLGCSGIFEQVRMEYAASRVLFDLQKHEIIGKYEDYFNERGQVREKLFDLYPWLEDEPDRWTIAIKCCKEYHCKNPENLTYGCSGMCCDLMHTKIKQGEEKYKYNSGRWRNVDDADISRQGVDKHCFKPCMEHRYTEPKLTRGYKKVATLDDFIDNYFSIENNVDAVVAHLRESNLVGRIKDYFLKTRLPDIIELQPLEHVYMFADGYLVAEHDLVNIPTFYGYDAPEFRDDGMFCNVDILNVFPSEVFRGESYDMQLEQCSERNQLVSETETLAICSVCGCPRIICEGFQNDYEDNCYTLSSINDWVKEESYVHDMDIFYDEYFPNDQKRCSRQDILFDFIVSSVRYFLRKDISRQQELARFCEGPHARRNMSISKHNFREFIPITRSKSSDFTNYLDFGVLDDLIIYQYDWQQPWRELPPELHAEDADGRFWKEEAKRIRQEILFQWGRLYYRKGEFLTKQMMPDKTQNMLGTVGVGNTGKSTALNMIKRGMVQKDVAVLDCSTFEQQFGLSQILDSTFVAINEVETDSKTLTAGLIKQLCDDSLMSAPQKNKDVKLAKMLAHIWFLGNEKLFSSDPSGALGRRIAQMHWLREVPRKNIDTQLETKFQLNFGHTLAGLHLIYWRVMEEFSNVDFWYKEATSYPHMSWMWHHLRSEGESITSKLTGVIKKFMKEKHIARFSPKDDLNTFALPIVDSSDELDQASNPAWFEEGGTYRLPVLYCPFQNMNRDSGKEGDGFKTKHINKLKDLYSRVVPKADNDWGRGYDFYGRSFEQNGLLLLESKAMPWPICGDGHGNHPCITTDWIVGMTFVDLFNKEDAEERKLLDGAPVR